MGSVIRNSLFPCPELMNDSMESSKTPMSSISLYNRQKIHVPRDRDQNSFHPL